MVVLVEAEDEADNGVDGVRLWKVAEGKGGETAPCDDNIKAGLGDALRNVHFSMYANGSRVASMSFPDPVMAE